MFSSEVLFNTDKEVYESLKRLLPDKQIEIQIGIDSDKIKKLGKADYLVIDEADDLILDKLCDLSDACCKILAMSATPICGEATAEKEYLDLLNFKIFDSEIANRIDSEKELNEISLEDFLEKGRSKRARFIYCEDT